MAKVWKVREGSPFKDSDAAIIGEALEKLESDRGIVTPVEVVTVAKNRKHPLHGYFEWDDSRAAEAHRLKQARDIIGSIRVVIESDDGPVESRGYYHIRTEDDEEDRSRSYMSTDKIMSHDELKMRLLQQALDEAERWKLRYQNIREFAEVFAALKKVRVRVVRKTKRKELAAV